MGARHDEAYSADPTDEIEYIFLPRRNSTPLNGKVFTWADDALNLSMRAREHGADVHGAPPVSSPSRCRGFSVRDSRPCRAWSATNAEGMRLWFCKRHLGTSKQLTKGQHSMSGSAIVARASKAVRHGAYSDTIRIQMREAIERNKESGSRDEFVRDLEVIESIDPDDVAGGLKDATVMIQAAMARMNRRYYAGDIKEMEYLQGLILFSEQLRKLLATRHDIKGTASDQLSEAINDALNGLGLGNTHANVHDEGRPEDFAADE